MRTLRILPLILAAFALVSPLTAEDLDTPPPGSNTAPNAAPKTAPSAANPAPDPAPNSTKTARITGTVTDVNEGTVPGATIVLQGPALQGPRKLVSNQTGFFEFNGLDAGSYTVSISVDGFSTWTSPPIAVAQGQYVILTGTKLRLSEVVTSVNVVYSAEKVATEQVKAEEQQRVFGFIPNFYVVYEPNPEPLTAKLKFQLAFKTTIDPITLVGAATLAGINQAADTPNYVQGAKGYGERAGAVLADGTTNILIGGALLPALLRQDPRYFYQGTGSNRSRTLHALSAPFLCRGDNGKWQPNYSSVGGDLASAAISNLYYPSTNRGTSLVFENVAISTGERMLGTLVQEFVLRRFTNKPNKN